jgi:hypothetical protein
MVSRFWVTVNWVCVVVLVYHYIHSHLTDDGQTRALSLALIVFCRRYRHRYVCYLPIVIE